ncbi:RNA polymerase-binding protein DksA [Pusillimonas sp. ANT_WB101]|uniref:RNA polymerase-binding protein DksA n=1 Tax=Pusillimonas sp. ANT_WB101 TaxID=2597356 RepID=UPI0011ED2E78|nr:RNA polymerase-binding protein DksA [Pusillimonas sp. ANT_WB101]KAA0911099.1 RNA polymerase-binding protein DksA [Pusillimonas sp. ANT_WB101]
MAKETRTAGKQIHLPTEEQLLAMSPSEYMNSAQLAFFQHRLQELEREIHNNTDKTTETLRGTEFVSDPSDRATIEEAYGVEFRTRDRELKLLIKIRQALGRIESGDYGWCDETGEPIGLGRLLARPTATLTLEAQERRELRQKSYEDR